MKVQKHIFQGGKTHLLVILASLFVAIYGLYSVAPIRAASPAIISFQGKVVNADGTNVTNGSYNFDFVMYSDPTLGTPSDGVYDKWHELTKSVTVTNGVFQTNLGSATALPDFNTNNSLYLAVRFNADAAGYMSPRVQMASVPYALNADKVGGVAASSIVQLGASQSGNIDIGSGTLTSGNINGQTISTSANFTGTLAVQGASVTVGATGQAGSLVLYDSDAGSETVTLVGGAITSSYSLTLPTAAGSTSECLKTDASVATQLIFGSCGGGGSTLQTAYTSSTGSTTPEIILDTTRNGVDIQDQTGGTIGTTQGLLNVRGVATASTLGASLFTVNGLGQVAIKNGDTTATPTISYDLSFGQNSTPTLRTIGIEDQATAATAGNALTVSSGRGNTSGAGGLLTLQSGEGGTTGAGGNITVQGGSGGSASGSGGVLTLQGGNATTGVSNGGSVVIAGGAASSTGAASTVSVTSGSAAGAGTNGGALTMTTGAGNTIGAGGQLSLNGGAGGATGNGGAIVLVGGSGGSTSGVGGNITLQSGSSAGGNSSGGTLILTSGSGTGAGAGGTINMYAAAGGVTGNGGSTTVRGGAGGGSSGNGGALILQGGNAIGGTSAGGNVTIAGGFAIGTGAASTISITSGASAGATIAGGALNITSGAGNTTGTGGTLTVLGGQGGATGVGAQVVVRGGAGGSTSGAGGALTLQGGNATAGSSIGGAVNILGGTGSGTTGGSAINITAGAAPSGATTGGAVNITSGAGGVTGSGGTITLQAANAGASAAGGSISVLAGSTSGTSSLGGDITITAGAGGISVGDVTITAGASVGGNITGGNVYLRAGAGSGASSNGGLTTVTGGAAGTTTSVGGGVTVVSGAGGSTSGNSGAITLQSGNVTSGTAGDISIDVGTSTSGNGAISIGTAARTQTITIGNSTGGVITVGASSGSDLVLNDAQWSVTGAGAATFASALIQGGTATLGATAQAGSLVLFDSDAGSETVTLVGGAIASSFSLTLPTAAGSTSQCLQTDSVTASQLVFASCSAGGGDNISVNGSAAADANFLDTTATGTLTGVTFTLNGGPAPDTVAISIGNASISAAGSVTTGTQTFGGVKTFDDNVFITGSLAVGDQADRADLTVYGSILKKGIAQQTGLANIIDVFVYDTTRDSDGGDWTNSASSKVLSWYTETLDDGPGDVCVVASDDRCGRVNFPRKAVVVTTPSAVYIFNSTDGTMFMKFTQGGTFALGADTNNNPSGAYAINGVVYIGTNGTSGSGLYAFDFVKDRMFNYDATDRSQGDKDIANRNTTIAYATDNRTSFAFASSIVNDVHGQIIRGSQTTATTTAVPLNGNLFIVVATDSSASLINTGNGKVLEYADTATDDVNQVWLTARGTLYLTNEALAQLERYNFVDVDTADQITPDDIFDEQVANIPHLAKTTPTMSTSPDALQVIEGSSLAQESSVATIVSADTIYVGHSQGLTEIDNVTTPSGTVWGWSKFYTTTTQTGFMSGTPRGMFGFDDASGDITDATIRNNVLQVKGTPTYLLNGVHGTSVGYNGTNQYHCSDANNDATCDTDADFDPGTISWTIEAWFKHATTVTGTDTLIDHTYTTTPALGAGYRITMNSSGQILAGMDDDGTAFDDDVITSPAGTSYADGLWHHVLFERVTTATGAPAHAIGLYLYIDGRSVGSDTTIAVAATLNGSTILGIGADCSVGAACGTGANFWDGQIDDVYISMNGATSSETLNALSGAIRRRYLEGKSALAKSSTSMDNATTATSTTLGDSTAAYSPNEFAGQIIEIYGGTGSGQTRRISSNDTTTFTVTPAFTTTPDTTSDFRVAPELLFGTTNSVTGIGITDNDFFGQSRTLYVGTSDGADGGGVSVFRGYGTTSRTEIYQSGADITDDAGNSWSGTDSDDIKAVEARSDTIVIGTDANLWIQRDDRTFEQSIDQVLNSLALTREELRVDGLQGISSEVGAFAGADLAENYMSDDALEAGEIVSMAKNEVGKVKRSTTASDKATIGIVASAPGIVLGASEEQGYPIALVGRVPVKVSTQNGEIKSGDRLTSSDIAGYGMKATSAGRVIGTALEDFSEDKHMLCADGIDISIKCGTITVFVNLADYTGENINVVLSDAEKQGLTYDEDLFDPLTSLLSSGSEDSDKFSRASKILSYLSARRQALGANGGSEVLTDTVNTAVLNSSDIYAQNIYATGFTVSDLKANRVSGLEMLTVNGSAEFRGNTLFKGLVTFVEKTVFNNDITFNGRTTFNSDTAGFAVIKTGKDEVAVKFDRPYEQIPVVTINIKNGTFADYNYKDLSVDGFTIKLKESAAQDTEFAWTALSIKDAKTSENTEN